jgi:S1-C subfamily serine protease/uncharacterized protein
MVLLHTAGFVVQAARLVPNMSVFRFALAAIVVGSIFVPREAAAFDCVGLTLPSNIVICSDPDLMRLADERQAAINETRGRIGEVAWPALWDDQKAWVRSYATNCGVPPDGPPPNIPVSQSIRECFKQAAVARIAYLRAYGVAMSTPLPSATASARPPERTEPSFDCLKANTRTEKAICADPNLRNADGSMAHAFATLRDLLPVDEQQGLILDQREWLKSRDHDCDYNFIPDFSKCLLEQTRYRSKWLSVSGLNLPNGVAIAPHLLHEGQPNVYQITVLYPYESGGNAEAASRFNDLINHLTVGDANFDTVHEPNGGSVPNTYFSNFSLELLANNLVSVLFSTEAYTGGAHGSAYRYAMLVDANSGKSFDLKSLLVYPQQAVPEISELCKVKLKAEASREGWATSLWFDDPNMKAEGDPIKEIKDARNWSVHMHEVQILFGQYTIGPYVIGMHECSLTYAELAPWIDRSGPLGAIANIAGPPPSKISPPEPPSDTALPHVSAIAPPAPRAEPKPAPSGSGTAFAVNSVGDFVTNYHVIKGCSGLRLHIHGEWKTAETTASDEQNDLAVIHTKDADTVPSLHFREGKAIRPADEVVALGFPYAGVLTTNLQVTTGAVSALSGIHDDTRYLQLTAPVQPGNSGGPLLDLSGNVVGIVSGRLNALLMAQATGTLPENVNFAIKSGIVQGFLDANRIDYQAAQSVAKLDPADVGETAAKSVFIVECQ